MAKKFYAVAKGIQPGIYNNWADCKVNIDGFSGALYKSFFTEREAIAYIDENESTDNSTETEETDYDKLVTEALRQNRLVAFTDGGYRGKSKMAGYGVYFLTPEGRKSMEISDIVRTEKFQGSNIALELMAVITAFNWALSNEYDKVTIFHDYEGVYKWANNNWKAKSDIARWFISKLEEKYNDALDIEYIWVSRHMGEEADRLASELHNLK